ncbi:MAG: hypothetical protein IPM29_04475 [Planctomycetes bacterium]|nr:hypothetical protein [Planctomycetota bacterium]
MLRLLNWLLQLATRLVLLGLLAVVVVIAWHVAPPEATGQIRARALQPAAGALRSLADWLDPPGEQAMRDTPPPAVEPSR